MEHKPKTIVPSRSTAYVVEFCKSISGMPSVNIPVIPSKEDESKECMVNVRRHADREGGESVQGWQITELEGLMIEAQFHVIWRMPDGQLRDVTPHDAGFTEILFLPDPTVRYEKQQINNIRKALVPSPDMEEFIAIENETFALFNKGDRAKQHGNIQFSAEEFEQLDKLEERKNIVRNKILKSYGN